MPDFRMEHDFLGEKRVPFDAYYGIQTLRALENFDISGVAQLTEPYYIKAFAMLKKAAALANRDCGVLEEKLCDAIVFACDELIAGKYVNQFITDMVQGGAGTSTNMNVNEVIANIGLEYLGKEKGAYQYLHPNDHINGSQSTNDVYPSAIRLALFFKAGRFAESITHLADAFQNKSVEFERVLKMGRTQLQDAVPMTLGQEFAAFGDSLKIELKHMDYVCQQLLVINMGGTAIGTGITAPTGYAEKCLAYLREITGLDLSLAKNLIEASSDTGAFVLLSSVTKSIAIKLSKICNDLRLLASGPRAGFFEINLPKMQPGSSIMPGKVNPVIPEVVNQAAFYAIGADTTVGKAAEAGQLQLNVMEPIIAFSLFTSIRFLTNAVDTLIQRCVTGITANEDICKDYVLTSAGIVTMLNPIIGYEESAAIAKEALQTGNSVHYIAVVKKQLITQKQWDELSTMENLVNPQHP